MNLFWPLLFSLFLWACIAVFIWAPWWVSLLLVAAMACTVLLCLLEHARAPVIVFDDERKHRHRVAEQMVREYQRRQP